MAQFGLLLDQALQTRQRRGQVAFGLGEHGHRFNGGGAAAHHLGGGGHPHLGRDHGVDGRAFASEPMACWRAWITVSSCCQAE